MLKRWVPASFWMRFFSKDSNMPNAKFHFPPAFIAFVHVTASANSKERRQVLRPGRSWKKLRISETGQPNSQNGSTLGFIGFEKPPASGVFSGFQCIETIGTHGSLGMWSGKTCWMRLGKFVGDLWSYQGSRKNLTWLFQQCSKVVELGKTVNLNCMWVIIHYKLLQRS